MKRRPRPPRRRRRSLPSRSGGGELTTDVEASPPLSSILSPSAGERREREEVEVWRRVEKARLVFFSCCPLSTLQSSIIHHPFPQLACFIAFFPIPIIRHSNFPQNPLTRANKSPNARSEQGAIPSRRTSKKQMRPFSLVLFLLSFFLVFLLLKSDSPASPPRSSGPRERSRRPRAGAERQWLRPSSRRPRRPAAGAPRQRAHGSGAW